MIEVVTVFQDFFSVNEKANFFWHLKTAFWLKWKLYGKPVIPLTAYFKSFPFLANVSSKYCQLKQEKSMGGSPGLVVMGETRVPKGHDFESWHLRLDGHFSHTYMWKKIIVCLKRRK